MYGYQQIIESIQAAAAIHRGESESAPAASDAHPILTRAVLKNRQCLRAMRGDTDVRWIQATARKRFWRNRKDGKRVAGKQSFAPPGSGGSRPVMKPRDLDFIPEMVGGKRSNQQVLTFTIEQEQGLLLENQYLL